MLVLIRLHAGPVLTYIHIMRQGLHRLVRHLAVLALAGLAMASLPSAALAAQRSPEDCERLTDWHAYNTCLASFGPRRGQRASGAVRAGDPEARVYGRARAPGPSRAAPGLAVERVKGGRVRATLDIGAAAPRRTR
jgi:hypothetical protein